tara:strand:- start:685 stop:1233 length:549 start_codon:yes stop_codon:yes gene_type:complete
MSSIGNVSPNFTIQNQSNILNNVFDNINENQNSLVKSIPLMGFTISLIALLMHPTPKKAIFFYGMTLVTVLGLITTDYTGKNFEKNHLLNFHALILGYVFGYSIYNSASEKELGYTISQIILFIILTIVIFLSIRNFSSSGSSNSKDLNIITVALSSLFGLLIGLVFSYLEKLNTKERKNKK